MAHVPEAVLVDVVQIFPLGTRITRHLIPSLGDESIFFFQSHLGLVSLQELAAGFREEGPRRERHFGSVSRFYLRVLLLHNLLLKIAVRAAGEEVCIKTTNLCVRKFDAVFRGSLYLSESETLG